MQQKKDCCVFPENHFVVFKSYLKIAWRNLKKERSFSLLNLLGLSAGLACALLIYLWVQDEQSMGKLQKPQHNYIGKLFYPSRLKLFDLL